MNVKKSTKFGLAMLVVIGVLALVTGWEWMGFPGFIALGFTVMSLV